MSTKRAMEIDIPEDAEQATEDSGLMGRGKKKSSAQRSCAKVSMNTFVTILATAVFVVLFVQLWITYAELINRKVFSPSIVATGKFGCVGEKDYAFGASFDVSGNGTRLLLTLPDIPPEPMVFINTQAPTNWTYAWKDSTNALEVVLGAESLCTNVFVLSS